MRLFLLRHLPLLLSGDFPSLAALSHPSPSSLEKPFLLSPRRDARPFVLNPRIPPHGLQPPFPFPPSPYSRRRDDSFVFHPPTTTPPFSPTADTQFLLPDRSRPLFFSLSFPLRRRYPVLTFVWFLPWCSPGPLLNDRPSPSLCLVPPARKEKSERENRDKRQVQTKTSQDTI